MGLTQRNPPLVVLFYLLPVLGMAAALAVLAGYAPSVLWARWKPATPIESGA
jgi:hypothetical protein